MINTLRSAQDSFDLDSLEIMMKEISGASKLAKAMITFQISEKIILLIKQKRQSEILNLSFKEQATNGLTCLLVVRRIVELKGQESPLSELKEAYQKIMTFIEH